MFEPDENNDGLSRPLLADNSEPEYGTDGETHVAPVQGTFTRNLGAIEAFAIVISIVIGSGVFTSPGSIDANVPSPGVALLIWLVGGVLAWTGASTLAELGTAIPGEGGVQPYLQYIFGDIFGFLAAWTWIVAVMPATLAILSIVFIESIFSAAGTTDQAGSIEHKLLDSIAPDGSTLHWGELSQWERFGHYSAALYGALWAYSGWDKAVYISAELSAPARQLPLAINTAVPTIILCFVTANAAYYILLPWDLISTTDSVAVTAISRLLGPGVGIVAAILVCLVVAGSLLGNSFVAGRMTVAAGNKNWLPRLFAVVGRIGIKPSQHANSSDSPKSSRSDAPLNALLLSATLSALYILFGNFRALLTFNGLGEYSFFFLTVVGAIILRFREPDLHRPYKPFALIPVIFAVVSGFVVVRGAIFAPVQAVILVVVWIIGTGIYTTRRALARNVEEQENS
ncbi:hypothetical protein B7494_g319 [Chlorociboria aeruginascens]|nr:hypothetical protein B7494_g319 [Chlorociboria aeruginascens]